ncbi:MAG: glycosyltransferase family 2 protein [Gemmatimonadetes bacterium]|nr:glycosyltransferase family 2 protein [Gemmatimonadota bacterium]
MEGPVRAVVVPLYNKCSRPSGSPLQILSSIVDDGSQDGSAAIAAGYPDSRFRMIRQANAGPGAARNRGIAEAKGEWIAFLDADDEWLPDYLELAVRQFRSLGEDVASVSSGYYDFHGPARAPKWEAWHRGGSLRVQGMETTAGAVACAQCSSEVGWLLSGCRSPDSFLMGSSSRNGGVRDDSPVIIHTEAGQLSKNQRLRGLWSLWNTRNGSSYL